MDWSLMSTAGLIATVATAKSAFPVVGPAKQLALFDCAQALEVGCK